MIQITKIDRFERYDLDIDGAIMVSFSLDDTSKIRLFKKLNKQGVVSSLDELEDFKVMMLIGRTISFELSFSDTREVVHLGSCKPSTQMQGIKLVKVINNSQVESLVTRELAKFLA